VLQKEEGKNVLPWNREADTLVDMQQFSIRHALTWYATYEAKGMTNFELRKYLGYQAGLAIT